MGQQVDLQALLETILGSTNVYFQPPSNVQMVYPCIVYSRDNMDTDFADNKPYNRTQRYSVTYIDRSPTSIIPGKIADLPQCLFNRFYVAENLNHDVFVLYF
jgi:hypothetical protein